MTELIVMVIAALVATFEGRRFLLVAFLSGEPYSLLRGAFDSVSAFSPKKFSHFRYVYGSLKNPKGYQIKHILLIDRESGIQIEEVSSKDSWMFNCDAISAMFSAIQSFVQDSFSADRSSMLTDFRVGDHLICVAHGPKLMLACVMIGEVPPGFKYQLDNTLQIIQSEFITSLSDLGQRDSVRGVANVMNSLMLTEKPMTLDRRIES